MESMCATDVAKLLSTHPQGSFLDVVKFNGYAVGACDITGISPVWEMHPDTDELFFILDGEFEITVLTESNEEQHVLGAGQCFVVPRGYWHKPGAPSGARFLYFTPGQTLHSDVKDPRHN